MAAMTAQHPIEHLTRPELETLVKRIDEIPLFAHAYAFHLNFRLGAMRPEDLLHYAKEHALQGVKIHVEDGEERSLLQATVLQRRSFGALAKALSLSLDIETSSTEIADLSAAIAIARDTGAGSVRFYPRYQGRVSDIITRTISDLRQLPQLDPAGRFRFLLEQHEDLKSFELVKILAETGHPNLSLLFDFGNMVNAYETPEAALSVMAPYVTDVHMKDVQILDDRGGWAHRACRSGEGDIDFAGLLVRLLLLGKDKPQVRAFALEEENEMYAPAYRFPDEEADPVIPARDASTTLVTQGEALQDRLAREQQEAVAQIGYVRKTLQMLKTAAEQRLCALRARME